MLPGVNRSCRSGEARPSRLSQKTCEVVTPKVSAPLPVKKKRRISGSTRGKRAISFTVSASVHAMDDADHVVVDQVGADARQVVHDGDAERLQVRGRADAGDLQDDAAS